MIVFKCRIIAVDITAFDVKIIENQRALLPVWQDIIISLAGPLGNILAIVLFIWINKTFAYINLFLGLFNLLPCISLDGGQSLYLILSKKLSNQVAKKIIEVLTVITMFPTFVMGIIVLFKSTYNFSLLFLSLYLLLLLLTKKI
jgi:stage IV sporulation protein FB